MRHWKNISDMTLMFVCQHSTGVSGQCDCSQGKPKLTYRNSLCLAVKPTRCALWISFHAFEMHPSWRVITQTCLLKIHHILGHTESSTIHSLLSTRAPLLRCNYEIESRNYKIVCEIRLHSYLNLQKRQSSNWAVF